MTTCAAPDLAGMRPSHRVIVVDLLRLTQVARGISERSVACPDRRAFAIGDWVRALCAEIGHHRAPEGAAGHPVERMLEEVRAAVAVLEDAAVAERGVACRPLAAALAALRDHLTAHVGDGEAGDVPAVGALGPAAGWARVEAARVGAAVGRGGAGPVFALPRFLAVAADEERRAVLAAAGPVARTAVAVLAPVLVALHRRRERLVFG